MLLRNPSSFHFSKSWRIVKIEGGDELKSGDGHDPYTFITKRRRIEQWDIKWEVKTVKGFLLKCLDY
jgi:hypothetical protein